MDVYERAKHSLESGQLESSFKLYSEFISLQKDGGSNAGQAELSDAYNSRGHIRYLWVDFDEAIDDYTEAIRLDPKFAVAYYNRGQIHYRLARFHLAEKDLETCVQLDPLFKDAKLNLEQVKRDIQRLSVSS